jgi:hypothetical protein
MQAYDASLAQGDQSTLVLSPDSTEFLRYFERGPTGAKR